MGRTTLVLAAVVSMCAAPAAQPGRIPLVQTTDLYHPPMDPDDHVDLATVFAMPEFDLRAVIFDADFRMIEGTFSKGDRPREPGFVPVAQLAYMTGRSVPSAIGPLMPLSSPSDAALDRPRHEQAGIELLLRVLRESPDLAGVEIDGGEILAIVAVHAATRPLLIRVRADQSVLDRQLRHHRSELCDKQGLQPTIFYRWQKEFFENGAAAFQQKGRPDHSAEQERIAYLENKIQTKDEVLAGAGGGACRAKKSTGEL